jgi:AcrR family transcriptional regulator
MAEKGRKRDRSAREFSLLRAATKIFALKGFESTTTREIAAEAGCAEGLIHRYFEGKNGLLLAIVRQRTSQEAVEFMKNSWPTATIEEELAQLVEWEVEHAWSDREFMGIVLRQAALNTALAEIINTITTTERAKAITERLMRFKAFRDLPKAECDALAHFVISSGFMFGFMRPVVLRQDRVRAAEVASTMAKMLGRSLSPSSFSVDTFTELPATP